jgi:hypothetical protein
MVVSIFIAALVLLIIIVFLSLIIKKRMEKKHYAGVGEVAKFQCTPTNKVDGAAGLSANDTYDCVEQGK